jgi:murein DD-endopeptidase MepM/ murein hydrolase activator NlpD
MNKNLHIIITSDSGRTLRYPCNTTKVLASSIAAAATLLFLCSTSFFSISLFTRNTDMARQLASLQERVDKSDQIIAAHQKQAEEEKLRLGLKVANLELDKASQSAAFKEEKETLMSTAVSELNARSELIARIMAKIGIKVSDQEDKGKSNSGGPFIAQNSPAHNELLNKADLYLEAIRFIPLGRPVSGPVASGFGDRQDPLNGEGSFHAGIDFRGTPGEKIYATAAGIVTKAFRNGTYGNYVEIDHQNGYVSCYAHMQKFSTTEGAQVRRGELIGYVGNTGRSTGPHLHYEVHYKDKPINPMKYMQVADLVQPDTTTEN